MRHSGLRTETIMPNHAAVEAAILERGGRLSNARPHLPTSLKGMIEFKMKKEQSEKSDTCSEKGHKTTNQNQLQINSRFQRSF
jgi:hypothetical protein